MKCPSCDSETDRVRSIVVSHEIKDGCDKCLGSKLQQGNELSASHMRNYQKTHFRKDLIQPNQTKDFIKAYPEESKEYYDEETRRKYS